MKNTNVKEFLRNHKLLGNVAALALAVVVGGSVFFQNTTTVVPEFPEIIDPITETSIFEEETPLASAPKVTTNTTTKTTKKKVKLSKASQKSYTSKLPVKKKTATKKKVSSNATITTETTTQTAVTEKYTKKSSTKLVTTTVTTTVKTTTVESASASTSVADKTYTKYTTTVDQIAPKMDSRVINAYNTLNFKVNVDPNVGYSGYFDAKNQSITLNAKQFDNYSDTIYHELGHFLAFIAGNVDTKADYVAIYNAEKNTFAGVNKAYAVQSSSEFFAECVRTYVLDPATLKNNCPKTYAAIENALNSITDTRVQMLKKVYSMYWHY